MHHWFLNVVGELFEWHAFGLLEHGWHGLLLVEKDEALLHSLWIKFGIRGLELRSSRVHVVLELIRSRVLLWLQSQGLLAVIHILIELPDIL